MRSRAQIVILNGVGSVGKSSTAKTIQGITSKPFLHVAMDALLDMLPKTMLSHPEGLMFEASQDDGKPIVTVRSGPVLDRVMSGMRHAVAALADQGNNLIVDEVMIGPQKAKEYREVLHSHDVYMVGLMAPLDVLEARERARGDRETGLARGQYGLVHRDMVYDLEVDTAAATPIECARVICNALGL